MIQQRHSLQMKRSHLYLQFLHKKFTDSLSLTDTISMAQYKTAVSQLSIELISVTYSTTSIRILMSSIEKVPLKITDKKICNLSGEQGLKKDNPCGAETE